MRARFESKYFQMEYAGSKNHSQRTSICQNLFIFQTSKWLNITLKILTW